MAKILIFCFLSALALASAQRITTIHLDGVQYFISRMNPYSPELNYFLAYQYCRSLGLQLASFETKEKAESMTTYLKNAGYGNYDFWTSGNRLGTGMFLWMSTGLPFNATFDFFENSADAIQAGLLDPVDHNSNTSPQRTARDSSSGAEKGCVILKQPTLKWMPEDCSVVKDFICEQTRCYYYNYGSIPVSSAQGRPITSTTPRVSTAGLMNFHTTSTTPLPMLMSAYAKKKAAAQADIAQQPSFASLKLDHERALDTDSDSDNDNDNDEETEVHEDNNDSPIDVEDDDLSSLQNASLDDSDDVDEEHARELNDVKEHHQHQHSLGANDLHHNDDNDEEREHKDNAAVAAATAEEHYDNSDETAAAVSTSLEDDVRKSNAAKSNENSPTPSSSSSLSSSLSSSSTSELPAVEVRLKQISQEIEKMANSNENQHHHPALSVNNHVNDDIGRQSFLSLTDLIRTLRPNDKQIVPQIDSDYSNAMRVLGENSASVVTKDNKDQQQKQQQQQQPNRGFF